MVITNIRYFKSLSKSILTGALFVLSITGYAQDTIVDNHRAKIKADSEIEDTAVINKKPHSPQMAIIFSAVIPGLGQAYNKKYWKIPIIYAGGIALVYHIDLLNSKYYLYKGLHDDKEAGLSLPAEYEQYSAETFALYRDYYRKWRDFNVILLSGLYFLNIIDAMVDAYFFEYDISDDLTLKIEPQIMQSNLYTASAGMKISLRF